MSSKGGGGSWVGVLKVRPIAKNHKKKTKKKRKEPRYIIVYIWRIVGGLAFKGIFAFG